MESCLVSQRFRRRRCCCRLLSITWGPTVLNQLRTPDRWTNAICKRFRTARPSAGVKKIVLMACFLKIGEERKKEITTQARPGLLPLYGLCFEVGAAGEASRFNGGWCTEPSSFPLSGGGESPSDVSWFHTGPTHRTQEASAPLSSWT